MLKNILIAAAILITTTGLSAAETKIAVVDMQYIFSKSPQAKNINEVVSNSLKDRYEALSQLQKQGSELQEKAKRDEMTLTLSQKLDMKRKAQAIESEFNLQRNFLQEDAKMIGQQEQEKIYRQIKQAVNKVAADDKFDLVLNIEAAIFANSAINISDKVIAIISNPAG